MGQAGTCTRRSRGCRSYRLLKQRVCREDAPRLRRIITQGVDYGTFRDCLTAHRIATRTAAAKLKNFPDYKDRNGNRHGGRGGSPEVRACGGNQRRIEQTCKNTLDKSNQKRTAVPLLGGVFDLFESFVHQVERGDGVVCGGKHIKSSEGFFTAAEGCHGFTLRHKLPVGLR